MATTTEMEKMGKTAEMVVKNAQETAYTVLGYAVKSQDLNVELLNKTVQLWIDGLHKQADLTQQMAQEVFERAEDQANTTQEFFGRWGFPFTAVPFWRTPYDPFSFWREWPQMAQKTTWETRKTAAEQTARAIETTAPGNGSFPIAGYDGMNVGEISRRLDTLTTEQLRRVSDYEKQHKNRGTLVHEMERRIRAAS